MTPKQYIGHEAFRIVDSSRFPVDGKQAFAQWLQHTDGTLIFYLRGQVPSGNGYLLDSVAKDAFDTLNVCHCCVCCFSEGLFKGGDYQPHWSTSERNWRPNIYGKLCCRCIKNEGRKIIDEATNRLALLGIKFNKNEQLEALGL